MEKKIINLLLLFSLIILQACEALPRFNDTRPNFLIILTDDQRYDTMQYMPKTQSLIFDQGVIFQHGYITAPLCCPSRASILTGRYAHNHDVWINEDELHYKTVFDYLDENGYYTGLIGKYLNTWNAEKRPEFDFWVSYKFGETRYQNPLLNVNGEFIRHQGQYVTYALGDYAMEFLDKSTHKSRPFALLLAVNAPHNPYTPAPEDTDMQIELPPRLPSFNELDVSDKPAWIGLKDPPPDEARIQTLDEMRRGQILTLMALDRTLEKVLAKLEETGEMDNTVIIFLSDNGLHWGEHRFIAQKNTLYEESVHVPYAIRYPPLIPEPYVENKVVANIDIAPTLLDLAGIPIPDEMDGLSLVNLLTRQDDWREGVLIEGWPPRGEFAAIHTERYVYAETVLDQYAPSSDPQLELYDLEKDPYQMQSVAYDPQYKELIAKLKALLEQEKNR
ncbi:MAG: sulfatase-like hydrolase/transferase [Anaerolineales bacterium]|jgi:arylsulfatase A-like enzyme|nr:sulfatase-like hydrolase/transferase [Anaerolineales bacterium]